MKLTTAILLAAPAFFMAEGVYFASAGIAVVIASVIVLCSLACLAWGIWIFRTHRALACVCIVFAALYLTALVLLLQAAKATAKIRAGGDGGIIALFHAEPCWPAAPHHGRRPL